MIVVDSISWREGEVEISFAMEPDLREVAGKPVLVSRTITIPSDHPSYPEVRELYEAAQDVVRDVIEDWESAEVWTPIELDPEDDDDDD